MPEIVKKLSYMFPGICGAKLKYEYNNMGAEMKQQSNIFLR